MTSAVALSSPSLALSISQPTPASLATESVNRRVAKVYGYAALGMAITAISAAVFVKIGFAATLITFAMASPILTTIGLVAIGITLVTATILINPKHNVLKHGFHSLTAISQGLALSPLLLINPVAFVAATAGAVAITGGLGVLAMKMKTNFEKYEKVLMVGLGAIALASLGALFLPKAIASFAAKFSYFGGFALFSSLVIYDTQRARREAHLPDFDPIKHSMAIYLDAINLLVKIWGGPNS